MCFGILVSFVLDDPEIKKNEYFLELEWIEEGRLYLGQRA